MCVAQTQMVRRLKFKCAQGLFGLLRQEAHPEPSPLRECIAARTPSLPDVLFSSATDHGEIISPGGSMMADCTWSRVLWVKHADL